MKTAPFGKGAASSSDKQDRVISSSWQSALKQDSDPGHRQNLRFRRLSERVWRLGPRPVGELLIEVAAGRDLIQALEAYAALDAAAVLRLEARAWPPDPIHEVA
jgi:hypothetical protein